MNVIVVQMFDPDIRTGDSTCFYQWPHAHFDPFSSILTGVVMGGEIGFYLS